MTSFMGSGFFTIAGKRDGPAGDQGHDGPGTDNDRWLKGRAFDLHGPAYFKTWTIA